MGYPTNEKFILKYTYDFARDGGAVSTISLTPDINALAEGVVVEKVIVMVTTALTSGATPTVTIGNSGDVDGYYSDIWSQAQAVAAIGGGALTGDLIFDNTNDREKPYRIDGTANNQDVVVAIGTAALTAGAFSVYLECSYQ